MAVRLYPKNVWFSFFLQIIWAIVALIAIVILHTRRNDNKCHGFLNIKNLINFKLRIAKKVLKVEELISMLVLLFFIFL